MKNIIFDIPTKKTTRSSLMGSATIFVFGMIFLVAVPFYLDLIPILFLPQLCLSVIWCSFSVTAQNP